MYALAVDAPKYMPCTKFYNSVPNDKFLDLFKLKAFADDKIKHKFIFR